MDSTTSKQQNLGIKKHADLVLKFNALAEMGYKIPEHVKLVYMSIDELEKEYSEYLQRVVYDEREKREHQNQLLHTILTSIKSNPSLCEKLTKELGAMLMGKNSRVINEANDETKDEAKDEAKDETKNITIKILHLHKFI